MAVIAIVIARDPASKVLGLVGYAWAGFGAAFGPVVLFSLLWPRMTRNGALFGMLVGEQLIPVGRRLLSREPLTLAWFRHECVPKISGTAPPAPAKDTRDVK